MMMGRPKSLSPPPPTSFGEFLVQQRVLDRFQLFRALQMQDQAPAARLGECAAALGFVPIDVLEALLKRFAGRYDAEAMITTPFER